MSNMDCQKTDFHHAIRTVLRFAHAFDGGGGTETYVADIDRALLERLPLTIIRVHLTRTARRVETEEHFGQGRLIRVALPVTAVTTSAPGRSPASATLRDYVLYNPAIWRAFGRRWALSRELPVRAGEAIGASAAVAECLQRYSVDVVVVHSLGGRDADDVIRAARSAAIPVAVVNHYSNARFRHLAVRRHVMMADAVGGVSGVHLPRYVRDGFTNLSDGVDLDFFQRSRARPVVDLGPDPVVLLPARVVREKGHLDLLRAAAAHRARGSRCTIVFAGGCDGGAFSEELSAAVQRFGLADSVRFLGRLAAEQLRDWYAAAAVVAFPTFHDEGLPRTILEASAMGVPVVAYATHGVIDAVLSGQTGFLVPTGNVRQLASKLIYLLESDPQRAAMGVKGRKYVESRFALEDMAARHLEFYAAVINGADARRKTATACAS